MDYVTSQLDEVDLICYNYYGRTAGTVEAVLVLNPGLADMAPVLPQGLTIYLPTLDLPDQPRLRLWEQF